MPDIDAALDLSVRNADCIPFFHYEQKQDNAATEEAGSPVFKDVEYVKIIAPGNDKEVMNRRVKEADKQRWPNQYAAFKAGVKAPQIDGTPIDEWTQITRAQAATLKAANVFSVEQLAEVADQNIGNLGMGMMDLKKRAGVFVKAKAGEGKIQKYAQQNRRLEERNNQLEEQLNLLQNEVASLRSQLSNFESQVMSKENAKETPG